MGSFHLNLHVEIDREDDGRWFAVVSEIPGVMAYGKTEDEAVARVKVLTMQVLTDRLGRGEDPVTGKKLRLTGKKRRRETPRTEYLAAFSGVEFSAQLAG